MYLGFERRATARYLEAKTGAIDLALDHHIKCTVRDFSTAGVGLILPAANGIELAEFDLTFGRYICRCRAVWRQFDRVGLKIRSIRFASWVAGGDPP
jgi:hypothetical protein